MTKYLKQFETHSAYNTYINGQDKILPNVSYCVDNDEVHFNQYTDPKLVCKYNITDTSSATALRTEYEQNIFKSMEIDGVLLDNMVTEYQFSTTGEHTVKYELYDETKVGNNAPLFLNITALTSISIPNSVTTIGINAFGRCTSLTSIGSVGSGSSVEIPNSVTFIGDYAFSACTGLTSVTIGNSVTAIGENAFGYCSNLTSVTIPNSVTTIGNSAFYQCTGLTSITIPNGVTTIGYQTFCDCTSLTSITIPTSVTTIGQNAFSNCTGLTSITIPNSVTTIGNYAFHGCTGLTSVTIPNGVTTIGNNAFQSCSGLTTITSLATTAPTIQSSTFQEVKTGGTLYVPTGSTGYDVWMGTGNYYLGQYSWTKVEQ